MSADEVYPGWRGKAGKTDSCQLAGGTMPDVFDVLGHDHQEVKRMLTELEAGPTAATGASGNDLELRKKMVQQLVIEESKHEAVEEMYFWPAVRDRAEGGDRLADTATGQEQEGKEVLDKLDKLAASQPEFEQLLGEFTQAAREHIRYEETQAWPALRAALTAEQANDLGAKLEEGKKTAPTRPHPNTPASPGLLKTAGPAVAAADRARDAASGRGE
jgi:hemerythrin-like domain-containing protein